MFQAGLNTHRQERAGQPGDWRASPLRLSSRGTGTRAVLGDSPSHHNGGSAIRDARESACWGPCRPPALTPHTLFSASLPPVRLSTQVLPSFPDMTGKQPRGSLEMLAADYLAPVAKALAPVFLTTPPQGLATPFAGCRTTCHHPGSAPANQLPVGSPLSARSAHPLGSLAFKWHKGTSRLLLQGTLQRPLGVSECCLGEASAVHIVYDPSTLCL